MSSKKSATSNVSPTGRKLVQARLPFKTVTPKSTPTSPIAAPTTKIVTPDTSALDSARKRKRSVEASRPAKVNKTSDTKENIKEFASVITITDDEESKDKVDNETANSSKDEIVKTPKASGKKKVTSNKTPQANKITPQPQKQTPKQGTPRSSNNKRKASSPPLIIMSDSDEEKEEGALKSPSFGIKLPAPKKRHAAKAKTPNKQTKNKKAGNDLDISITEDGPEEVSDEVSSSTEKQSPKEELSTTKIPKVKGKTPNKQPKNKKTGNDLDVSVIEDSPEETPDKVTTSAAEKQSPKKELVKTTIQPVKAKTPNKPPRNKTAGSDLKVSTTNGEENSKEDSTPTESSKLSTTKTPTLSKTPVSKTKSPKKSQKTNKSAKTLISSTPTKVKTPIQSPSTTPNILRLSRESRSKSAASETVIEKSVEPESADHKDESIGNSEPSEKDPNESILIEDDEVIDGQLNTSVSQDSDKNGADTNSQLSTPMKTLPGIAVLSASGRKLTPKQLQRKTEADNRLKEKLLQKEERDRKAAEERERKEEQRRREKEEKEEQKRKERDDREKKRLEEIEAKKRKEEQKEEERKRKEEQKEEDRKRKEEQKEEERKRKEEQKEEERRKREEEKLAKEEADKKKNQKTSAAFTKFFTKPTQKISSANGCESNDAMRPQNFMPFCVKEDMKLAPLVRRDFSDRNRAEFDKNILVEKKTFDNKDLYIEQLRCGNTKRGRSAKTWTVEDSDVMVVDDELEGASAIIEEPQHKQTYKAKYFKFDENRRPAYYGTWRKLSTVITPRTPFKTDAKFFDYEVDSDDEWEEEEPGESLHGSDDEKDKESDDDYDIDNEFFVPHGHLSDEEVLSGDEADDEDNTPETQKAKLKIVQMEFADEMKKKTQKIKPRLIGLVYQQPDGSLPPTCVNVIEDMLRSRAMIFQGPTIQLQKQPPVPDSSELDDDSKPNASKRRLLPEERVADLIRLVHGNLHGKAFLVRDFAEFLKQNQQGDDTYKVTSNAVIRNRINDIAKYQACPDEGELQGKFCWYVSPDIREQYGVLDLGIPNTWTYILERPVARINEQKSEKKRKSTESETSAIVEETKPVKSKFNISNFTKVLSAEEKEKNFKSAIVNKALSKDAENSSVSNSTVPNGNTPKTLPASKSASTPGSSGFVKKRVNLLMSVPRGEAIPDSAKNALISKFLKNTSTPSSSSPKTEPENATAETIVLD